MRTSQSHVQGELIVQGLEDLLHPVLTPHGQAMADGATQQDAISSQGQSLHPYRELSCNSAIQTMAGSGPPRLPVHAEVAQTLVCALQQTALVPVQKKLSHRLGQRWPVLDCNIRHGQD